MIKPLALVVCGYGCHLNTPLRPYLDRVANFIQANRPGSIYLCGGYTQKKSAPNISEASLMFDYLKTLVAGLSETPIIIENMSYTSHENIRLATEHILAHSYRTDVAQFRIVIFCEAQRSPNIIMLARYYMHKKYNLVESIDDITVETANWERADPFKQAWDLIYSRLAIKFYWLAQLENDRRITRSHLI